MSLYVSIILLSALSVFDDSHPPSPGEVFLLEAGTTIGLVLAHGFASWLSARIIGEHTHEVDPGDLLLVQLGGALRGRRAVDARGDLDANVGRVAGCPYHRRRNDRGPGVPREPYDELRCASRNVRLPGARGGCRGRHDQIASRTLNPANVPVVRASRRPSLRRSPMARGREAHHAERVEQPEEAGEDRNEQRDLKGDGSCVGVDADDLVLERPRVGRRASSSSWVLVITSASSSSTLRDLLLLGRGRARCSTRPCW